MTYGYERNGTVQHSQLSKISITRVHDNITIYNCLDVSTRHETKTVTSETKTKTKTVRLKTKTKTVDAQD